MRRSATILLTLVLALAAFARPATAQDDSSPALGVARISLTDGDVTTRRGVSGDWVEARVNMPLVEGDVLATGAGSRAEVQLDYSNLVRLDSNTEVEVLELGNRQFRVRLLDGRVTYSELRGGEADVDIETPFAAVRPMKNGRYEVQVAPGETAIMVRQGRANIATEQGVEELKKNKMMVLREGPEGLIAREARAEPSRGWDEWNEQRDERLLATNSYRYVSRSVVGAEDLDYHGDWRYVSGYGYCWYPRGVGVGWAPYRQGRWLWVDYYGWSWVGYEPWGWAPYHYGRWFHHANWGWGWHPGHIYRTHYWRPALVSFFGFGSRGAHLSVGFGFGRVGWVPLAPGEAYYPWYGRGGWGRGGVTKIKNSTIVVDNSVNIYNVYRNARAHNGVTVVDAQSFSRGQLNNPQSLRSVELRRASLVRGQIPVVPARESLGRSAVGRASAVRASSRAGGAGVSSRGSVRAAAARPSFDRQRDQVARSVREFRTAGVRSASSAAASRGGVRASSGSTASGRAVPAAAARSGVRAASPGATRSASESSRWRRAGDSSAATRSSSPSTAGVRSTSRATSRSSASVRSGSPAGSLVNRSAGRTDRGSVRTESTSRWPQRSTSRVSGQDVGASSRIERSAPPSTRWPERPSSRVDRSGSTARSNSRIERSSAPSTRWPERSSSRVDRSDSIDRSSSRVERGSVRTQPSSIERSRSRVDRSSTQRPSYPNDSASRIDRSSSSRSSGRGSPSAAPSRSPNFPPARAPRSSPSVRSAPQRAPSAPSVRTPSRSGGGGVRSAPSSRPSGGVRSAPSRGGARSRER